MASKNTVAPNGTVILPVREKRGVKLTAQSMLLSRQVTIARLRDKKGWSAIAEAINKRYAKSIARGVFKEQSPANVMSRFKFYKTKFPDDFRAIAGGNIGAPPKFAVPFSRTERKALLEANAIVANVAETNTTVEQEKVAVAA